MLSFINEHEYIMITECIHENVCILLLVVVINKFYMYVHMCNIMRSNSCCFCVCIFILTQFSEPTSCFNEFCVLRIHEFFPRNFIYKLF